MIVYPENSPVQIKEQTTPAWTRFFWAVYQACFSVYQSGATAQRPTTPLWIGRSYFDTTVGTPVWWDGTNWIQADGSVV